METGMALTAGEGKKDAKPVVKLYSVRQCEET
jgi:hypothetical protein